MLKLSAKPSMRRRFPVRGLVVLAVLGAFMGTARMAPAQVAGVSPIVANPSRPNQRPTGQLPFWINRQDCVDDVVLTFAIGLTGSFSQFALEVWAGGQDCSPVGSRTGTTPTCWKVFGSASLGQNFQINVPIRARDIVAHHTPETTFPTNAQGVKPGALSDCYSTATSPPAKIILDFMLVDQTSNTAQTGHQPYTLSGYDIWGPDAPTNVTANAGETRLELNWTKAVATDTLRYDIYCDPPAGLLSDAGLLPDAGLQPLSSLGGLPGLRSQAFDSGVVGSGGFGGAGGFGGLGAGGFGGLGAGGFGGLGAGGFGGLGTGGFGTGGSRFDAGGIVTAPGPTCNAGSRLKPGVLPDQSFDVFRCGSVNGIAATSATVENLINDEPYTVAVVAVDQVNNPGVFSGQTCATPIEVTDFFELYKQSGGGGGGGLCSIAGPAKRAPLFGTLLGALAAAYFYRRRGRRP